jgi:hypothetical protein
VTTRRVLAWSALAVGVIVVVAVLAAVHYFPTDRDIRHRVETLLANHFDATVELKELHVTLFPSPRIDGGGLKLFPHDRPSQTPLLAVDRFHATATWYDLLQPTHRVETLDLQGLRITIAPKANDTGVRGKEHGGCQGERQHPHTASHQTAKSSPVLIAHLSAPGTTITMLPKEEKKLPRVFTIESLAVQRITLDQPLDFEAVLTNPVPRGEIKTKGQFGPWVKSDPGLAAVSGSYLFDKADLGTIDGIGGILTSNGRFEGVLEQILVEGKTETPDFSLDTGRHPMPLTTDFKACVDGTDGDTYLDEVNARLASSPIVAKGKIEGQVGVDGRTIALDARVNGGRIEDFLRLAVNANPPLLKGYVSLTTTVKIPPGKRSVIEKLQLKGQFGLHEARFTPRPIQDKMDEFSRRGQGRIEDQDVANVASDLKGHFTLANGVLHLPDLTFSIPGAKVNVRGTYGLVSEQIAFEGAIRTQAKLSQMTTGFKSMLLKVIDPLFARQDAGTVFPIHVSGTRAHPKFGVDVKGALTRKVK